MKPFNELSLDQLDERKASWVEKSDSQKLADWAEALRNGNYEQVVQDLGGWGRTRCALGVLSDISGSVWVPFGGNVLLAVPSESFPEALPWALLGHEDLKRAESWVERMNDEDRLTLPEIADRLEAKAAEVSP